MGAYNIYVDIESLFDIDLGVYTEVSHDKRLEVLNKGWGDDRVWTHHEEVLTKEDFLDRYSSKGVGLLKHCEPTNMFKYLQDAYAHASSDSVYEKKPLPVTYVNINGYNLTETEVNKLGIILSTFGVGNVEFINTSFVDMSPVELKSTYSISLLIVKSPDEWIETWLTKATLVEDKDVLLCGSEVTMITPAILRGVYDKVEDIPELLESDKGDLFGVRSDWVNALVDLKYIRSTIFTSMLATTYWDELTKDELVSQDK